MNDLVSTSEIIEGDLYTVASLNDYHIPYHDKRAMRVAQNFLYEVKPKTIVVHEWADFYALSKFDKDPRRKLELQKELDETQRELWILRNRFPDTEIVMIDCNHQKRLKKYLNGKADELAFLRCLEIEHLLGLDGMKIKTMPFYQHKKVLFKHGDIVRKDSSYTAKAEFIKEGMSGCSGHTHRLGMHFKTLRGGSFVWVEAGCLCKTKNVEYIEGTADWQQGLAVFFFEEHGTRFDPKVFPIINYQILWGRKKIGA